MCTLSWWQHELSYGVIFNRDESRTRSPAQPARLRERQNVSYLSPRDPDGGGTWLLPRLVGMARASELALLPTELNATAARDWGLINWVVPDDSFEEHVVEYAGRLARGPADAMWRAKALLNRAFDSHIRDHIETERLAQVENATSPDFEEGLTAFVEKREPEFGR